VTTAIHVDGVSKTYRDARGHEVEALKDVSLEIAEGEFVAFLGPSGCGKTTLLKMIDNMVQPDRGQVLINGTTAAKATGQIGFVFQDVALLPWRTVLANVALGLQARGMRKAEYTRTAMDYLALVGLERYADYYPWQLSGGMQQRVGIARALAISPIVLLLDEPFGAVDAITRKSLQKELLRIWDTLKITVVFVTHDVHEAVFLADRVVVFSANPGQVRAEVDVGLPRPRDESAVTANPMAMELQVKLTQMLEES